MHAACGAWDTAALQLHRQPWPAFTTAAQHSMHAARLFTTAAALADASDEHDAVTMGSLSSARSAAGNEAAGAPATSAAAGSGKRRWQPPGGRKRVDVPCGQPFWKHAAQQRINATRPEGSRQRRHNAGRDAYSPAAATPAAARRAPGDAQFQPVLQRVTTLAKQGSFRSPCPPGIFCIILTRLNECYHSCRQHTGG